MSNQLDIFSYPNSPGFKKAGTSKDAAKKAKPNQRDSWRKILEVLRRYQFTSDEVAHALQRSILYIRPRISELVAKGLVVDSGTRRTNDSGQFATVWRAA